MEKNQQYSTLVGKGFFGDHQNLVLTDSNYQVPEKRVEQNPNTIRTPSNQPNNNEEEFLENKVSNDAERNPELLNIYSNIKNKEPGSSSRGFILKNNGQPSKSSQNQKKVSFDQRLKRDEYNKLTYSAVKDNNIDEYKKPVSILKNGNYDPSVDILVSSIVEKYDQISKLDKPEENKVRYEIAQDLTDEFLAFIDSTEGKAWFKKIDDRKKGPIKYKWVTNVTRMEQKMMTLREGFNEFKSEKIE